MSPPPPSPIPGSAMVKRFGPLVRLSGLYWGLERVRLEDHAADLIRAASQRGPVVYLLLRESSLDHLALNAALQGTGLPLSVWARSVRTGWTRPWRRSTDAPDTGTIVDALRSGQAITLLSTDTTVTDLLEQLPDVAVQVIPVQIAWNRQPHAASPVVRFFSGQTNRPSVLRRLWRLWRRADVFVQVGQAIDLAQLGERVSHERLPKVLRRIAVRTLYQESRLVRGPRLLPYGEMKRRVLGHPPLRELARTQAQERGVSERQVHSELSRSYDKIAARFSWVVIRLLHVLLRPLWTRVFSGVDVRQEDLERIREAMREGTPILVPCHKSHFDYVLMSWVLYDNDLIVPHVVAGINLAVWPISVFLRGAGGFFIERSFTGKPLFPALFSRYLRELILRDYTVEFFIEGGRSRSGKLLPPRLGVLGMVLDAATVRHTGSEVTLLPISFSYEQVAEERAYAREIQGRKKRPESLVQFLRGSVDVLRRRFGKVYLRVGTPILSSTLVDAHDGTPEWLERSEQAQALLLQDLGERIMHRIGEVVVVLPSSVVALALMVHHRRAIPHSLLLGRIRRFTGLLDHLGVLIDDAAIDEGVPHALDRFLASGWVESHESDGERVWSMVPEQRLRLEFHKNQIVHHIAEAGVAAAALRAHDPSSTPQGTREADLLERAEQIRTLWSGEFVFSPDQSAEDALHRGLRALQLHGAITWADGLITVVPERAGEILGAFAGLLEAYHAVFTSEASAPTRRALAEVVQDELTEHLEAGRARRPEALSMDTLRNATRWLEQHQALAKTSEDHVRVDAAAVEGHVQLMSVLLGIST